MMSRLFVAGVLLRTCLGITLRPDAQAARESGPCRDAAPGEWCHAAAVWAKEIGFERRPDWPVGDASQRSLSDPDFQALLHQLGEAECSRPCPQDLGTRRAARPRWGSSSSRAPRARRWAPGDFCGPGLKLQGPERLRP
ncbi:unnamed protein product [Prorocentrum cordatum]|uniref:SLH domain-containing protein n=1 Tax=Prorocentrum cordatum TaxID=2364126 RepID=A0ABN9WMY6_9DINO|nr:unnamed protein product [Polarella glacialis]